MPKSILLKHANDEAITAIPNQIELQIQSINIRMREVFIQMHNLQNRIYKQDQKIDRLSQVTPRLLEILPEEQSWQQCIQEIFETISQWFCGLFN